MSARERRLQRRREERERQERLRGWHSAPSSGGRRPRDDEEDSAPFYAERVEDLLEALDTDVSTLVGVMFDVAAESGLKAWATQSSGVRSISQLLEGHATLDWVMDLVDATLEAFGYEPVSRS